MYLIKKRRTQLFCNRRFQRAKDAQPHDKIMRLHTLRTLLLLHVERKTLEEILINYNKQYGKMSIYKNIFYLLWI